MQIEWDTSPEFMTKICSLIQPGFAREPLCDILSEHFKQYLPIIPISGGWGHTEIEAIKFEPSLFPDPNLTPFVPMEYTIAEIVVACELSVFRRKGEGFVNISAKPGMQALVPIGDKRYDHHSFYITCWHEWHWVRLEEFRASNVIDTEALKGMFEESKISCSREFWFDITDVFHTQLPPETRKIVAEMDAEFRAGIQGPA